MLSLLQKYISNVGHPFKTVDQFKTLDEYSCYLSENLVIGTQVRCIENCDEIRKGDSGKVTKVQHIVHVLTNISHYLYCTCRLIKAILIV